MAFLDAQKVMQHVNEVYAKEAAHGYPVNVQQAMFAAVVLWDAKLRADFTTGMTAEPGD